MLKRGNFVYIFFILLFIFLVYLWYLVLYIDKFLELMLLVFFFVSVFVMFESFLEKVFCSFICVFDFFIFLYEVKYLDV